MKPNHGILLVNLGSPESCAVGDVKNYLREFLMDKYVIDAPYPVRKLIVEGCILPFRPKNSAEAYESIWWNEGSPLMAISKTLHEQLRELLDLPCELAMRYGTPSIGERLRKLLENRDINRILLVPLYPHYAAATVKTVVEKTRAELQKLQAGVALDVLPPFYEDQAYIRALAASMTESLRWDYDYLLFSYHGVPERHIKRADPTGNHCLRFAQCCLVPSEAHATCYRHQCFRTTDLVTRELGIPAEKYAVAFQSRLGIDAWLKPATSKELIRLARAGVKKLLVICPSFVSDCLETLEEIGLRGQKAFIDAGGEALRLIPCMNTHPAWVQTLAQYCRAGGLAHENAAFTNAFQKDTTIEGVEIANGTCKNV